MGLPDERNRGALVRRVGLGGFPEKLIELNWPTLAMAFGGVAVLRTIQFCVKA